MAESDDDKKRIESGLSTSRADLKNYLSVIRHNLDPRRYLWETRERHLWGWLSAAAILGWILSRLPARKQKIYVQSSDPLKPKKLSGGGGFLKTVVEGGWSIAKPLLAAYLTKKIKDNAKLRSADSVSEIIRWATSVIRAIKIG
jgi:hypothetical protein